MTGEMIWVLRVEVCYISSKHWLLAATTCHVSVWKQSVFLRFTFVKLAGCCSWKHCCQNNELKEDAELLCLVRLITTKANASFSFDLTALFKKYTIRICRVPLATPLHFFLAVCAQSAQHSLVFHLHFLSASLYLVHTDCTDCAWQLLLLIRPDSHALS